MKHITLFSIFILSLFSCTDQQKKEVLMPAVNGGLGEIVMVMPNGIRETELDFFVDSVFKTEYAGLPQPEPLFDVYKVPPHGFNQTFQIHRNILQFNINKKNQTTELKFKRDVWARPQLYVQLSAPDIKSCLTFLRTEYPKILGIFHKAERKRIEETHLKYVHKPASKFLKENFNIKMKVPKSMKIDMKEENFCWMSFITPRKETALLVYETPYTSKGQLSKDSLISWRDSILKRHITSEIEGSYMQTDKRLPISFNRGRLIDSCYSTELRGLWMMKEDFMAGPFINYTVVDTLRNRLVTVEGFVYAPNQKKRNDVRKLEAVLKSTVILPLTEEEKNSKK